jgi:hypothetical protein
MPYLAETGHSCPKSRDFTDNSVVLRLKISLGWNIEQDEVFLLQGFNVFGLCLLCTGLENILYEDQNISLVV